MLRAIRTPAAQPSALARPGSEATAEADSLLNRATLAEAEQQAQLEVAPVEARYSAALAVQVEAKHAQVERIEDKLETLIARQAETLSQVKARQPGLLSRPGTRAKWQRQAAQQQGTMTRLQDRLEHVRELRDTMGIHTPRIEEMAARKLRLQEPALAAEHDDWSSAARAHQALQRDQARRNRDRLTRGPGLALSLQRRPDR
jgi:hypothetical protein